MAHALKPVVHVGSDGVTDAVVQSIREAFHTRELLKVKVLETAPDEARETAHTLEGRIPDVHVPQVIGRTVVLYRRHPDDPEIVLP